MSKYGVFYGPYFPAFVRSCTVGVHNCQNLRFKKKFTFFNKALPYLYAHLFWNLWVSNENWFLSSRSSETPVSCSSESPKISIITNKNGWRGQNDTPVEYHILSQILQELVLIFNEEETDLRLQRGHALQIENQIRWERQVKGKIKLEKEMTVKDTLKTLFSSIELQLNK